MANEPSRPADAAPKATEHEARLNAVLRSLPLVVFEAETSFPFRVTWIEGCVGQVTGFTQEEWLRQPGLRGERLHPEDLERVRDAASRTLAGQAVELELRWRVADGSYRTFLERCEAVAVAPGAPLRWVGSWVDVTERRREEAELLASKEKYQASFQLSPYAVTLSSERDQKLIDANDAFFDFTGLTREQALGHTVVELGIWVDPSQRVRAVEPLQRTGAFFEIETALRGKDGRIAQGLLSGRRVTIGGEPCVLTVTRDVTEQREMERALEEAARSYRGLFDCVQEAIYIQSADGRFLDVNVGAERMYGLPREALVGQTPEIVSAPGRNDLPAVGKLVERAFAGEPQTFEFWGLRANGEVFPKEVRLYPGTYFGKPVTIALAQDITHRKRAEEAQLQAQKLESLGVLAGGIAHDFNNLLSAILGNLNLAQIELAEASPAQPPLADAERTVKTAAQLTRQLLAYSGKGRFEVKVHDLNTVVREMQQLLRVSIPRSVRLDLDLAPSLPPIKADVAQLQQVVMNLLTNAAEAIGDVAGQIAVSSWPTELDQDELATLLAASGVEPGLFSVLEVKDTGCGMSPEVLRRIFDPFFTTKATGRGLGLSAMLGILRGHRAGLRIRSEVGRGTTVQVFFPATEERPRASQAAPAGRPRPLGGTVLLVDAEEAVLKSTGSALRRMGFEVLTARSGAEALRALAEAGPGVRLVLMDVDLTGADGRAAYEAVRARHPDLPVVLSSGFDGQGYSEDLEGSGLAGFLQKPYWRSDLEAVLARALSRAAG